LRVDGRRRRYMSAAHEDVDRSLLIYRLRTDKSMNLRSWLTYSGRFIHLLVTRQLQERRPQDRESSPVRSKTDVLPLCRATNSSKKNKESILCCCCIDNKGCDRFPYSASAIRVHRQRASWSKSVGARISSSNSCRRFDASRLELCQSSLSLFKYSVDYLVDYFVARAVPEAV